MRGHALVECGGLRSASTGERSARFFAPPRLRAILRNGAHLHAVPNGVDRLSARRRAVSVAAPPARVRWNGSAWRRQNHHGKELERSL
jgi:hypothetical protein